MCNALLAQISMTLLQYMPFSHKFSFTINSSHSQLHSITVLELCRKHQQPVRFILAKWWLFVA